MIARRGIAIASTALAMVVAATVVASTSAQTADRSVETPARSATPTTSRVAIRERPRGAVVDCSTTPGWGGESDFTSPWNLVVGPLALGGARIGWAESGDGFGFNKLFVFVRGAHRVTVELSRSTRNDVGFAFGSPLRATRGSKWNLRNTRRIVTFRACQRGERSGRFDGWPVTSWVGFLLARSPQCVPLLVWVDDEPSPRRTVIRFGVPSCE